MSHEVHRQRATDPHGWSTAWVGEAAPQARRRNPRILVVTPEITYLPLGMGNMANTLRAKAGGLADVSASLVSALFSLGADIHVALPHYRRMFHIEVGRFINDELRIYKRVLPDSRIHLAQDRIFYYQTGVYEDYVASHRVALAFQREVINNILPRVAPDLVHCNDWMTGLIPPMARRLNIPCLFTVHNIHTQKIALEHIELSGIDAAEFWTNLYFERPPVNYEESRTRNGVDLLASGVFAAHFVNTVSPTFLEEICAGMHGFIPDAFRSEMRHKRDAGCAAGILNAPDPSYNPERDGMIPCRYTAASHVEGKRRNKVQLQERLGLIKNPNAPLFFWPSRLDPAQKGCQLLAEILHRVVEKYRDENLQVVFVANGPFQRHFHDIVRLHDLYRRVVVCDFDEDISRLGYAASDFMLMPSRFEPCGLPQMIGAIYGSLPVAHATGGLKDTVSHLDAARGTGNGFVFETHDSNGLSWAIDQAMAFRALPGEIRMEQVARVMRESAARFTHDVTARQYIELYEQMLERPLVKPG
ncbi:MAG: glycogen synthase [Lentisphaerae bacterium]|nr:glycogen synthase [Lentisphaerota bacterium]